MGTAGSNLNLISIPSLHLHGLKDVNLENGRKQLATFYDPKTSTVFEIDYHHAMPWHKTDVSKAEEMIRSVDEYTRGDRVNAESLI
jgi:hypothetical protein